MSKLIREQDIKILVSILYDKHGKLALTPEETALEVNRSEASLKLDREKNEGIPYTRINNKDKGKPLYNITTIARVRLDIEVKLFNN